LIPTGEKHFID